MTGGAAHRMSDPAVRTRVAFVTACLVALAWVAVTLLGRPTGPFAPSELPDVAGLPIRVPQISRLVPPEVGELSGDATTQGR